MNSAAPLAAAVAAPLASTAATHARLCARGLCVQWARHAGELARVADGGPVTADTVAAAALIGATAAELLTAAPLSPWWLGYVAHVGDALEGLCSLAGSAMSGDGLAAPGMAPAQRATSGALDARAAAHGSAAALAVGIMGEDAGIVGAPLDGAEPGERALLAALLDRATAGDDAALDLHRYLSAGADGGRD